MLTCPSCGRESPEDFAFCPACAAPLAPAAPIREVRKTVTVVFCDVTGSTALGARLDPESLRDVQSRYFDTMRAAIERHGGTVEKYIGDAVMAVFGIPRLHEDDAVRAMQAAGDMREGLAALNKELERDRGVTIQIRIGVNTGEVVAGDPSTGQTLVTGDAVNIAARLEQNAAPGEVLLADLTHRLVRDTVEAESVQPLELKGKAEPVAAWRLLRVGDVISGGPRRLDSPMVGRERQLAQLRQAFEAVVDDATCQLFTVLGPAGVGKSRLVAEFLSGIGPRATALRGRCLPYGEGITYFPVVEAIKQAASLADFDLPDVVETKVCAVLEGDEHRDLVCRHVAQLMGAAGPAAGEETFWAIRRFFEASAREGPLALVFDDIHWGEPTFLDLVEHIAEWSRGSPILLLCMARSDLLDSRPTWSGGKLNATTVSLEPLSDGQTETLIANLLVSADLPAEVAETIVQTAEGNPLFVEETLAMLIDDGLLTRKDGRWVTTGDLSTVTVPSSIQALLAARLDRLGPEERAVLEAAAVVGKQFFIGAVHDLVPEDDRPRMPSDLMALVRKELIRPDHSTLPGEDAFRFRHLLLRDAAYEAIPKGRRATLHELFADWLERVAGAAVAEQEEILGYHLEQAHTYRTELGPSDEISAAIGRRAGQSLASAGRRAFDRGDMPGVVHLLDRAIRLLSPDDPERLEALPILAFAYEETGGYGVAGALLAECVERARTIGDRRREWRAIIERSLLSAYVDPSWIDQAVADAETALGVFEELDDEAGLAKAWRLVSEIRWWRGRIVDAEDALERSIDHALRAGDRRQELEGLAQLPIAAFWGSTTTADEGVRRCDEILERAGGDRKVEALTRHESAGFLALQGRFDEAREQERLSLSVLHDLGLTSWVVGTGTLRGYIELLANDAGAAEREWRRSYELARQIGDKSDVADKAANLSQALYRQDRLDEAERFALIAEENCSERDLFTVCTARSARAKVLARRGRLEEAEALVRAALEIVQGTDSITTAADTLMDVAEVLRISGRDEEAVPPLREALDLYERKGNVVSAQRARTVLGDLVTGHVRGS